MRRRILVLAWSALATTGLLGLKGPLAAEATSAQSQALDYDRPGQLVRLPDGRRVNFRCTGQGAPLVILESGFGAGSVAWSKVQPKVALQTRVCSYDRAGYGFSEPGPLPRHGAAIARDLDKALTAARLRGPYVVVGHSAGGLYAQLFAARRVSDMAGLVLVDPSVAFQDRRMAALFGAGAGSVESILQRVRRCRQAAETGGSALTDPAFAECASPTGSAETRAEAARPSLWVAQTSELETLFGQTSEQRSRLGGAIRDVPVIVLTASQTGEPAPASAAGQQAWEAFHRDLADEFVHSSQRLVKSGHLMMNERPDAVAGAILELVAAARDASAAAKSHSRSH